ncbi:MAG: phycobiliprotein lyase [Oscillatoriales cyanobacterium C42_A2020_001]|nr:phycobiliprotein lyase [Leptolyngbyaceae cyanobacterium C42_A2020_001]
MLSFQDFFAVCSGLWKTERIYHYTLKSEIERSYTEFRVSPLSADDKQKLLTPYTSTGASGMTIAPASLQADDNGYPGFAIAFDTRSETGEEVSMSLKALFVPDAYITTPPPTMPAPPTAAQVLATDEVIQGVYLRDEGYSEAGAIAGRFTYQPTRQTLEMTTYYSRSVAVDQMRMVAPDMRLRTIVTYQRPESGEPPTVINLVGFGVEYRQAV